AERTHAAMVLHAAGGASRAAASAPRPTAGRRSVARLLHAPAVEDARVRQTALERVLGRCCAADRLEAVRIVAIDAERKIALALGTLERLVDLDPVGDARRGAEVEDDVAFTDHDRRLGHVLGELDAAPVDHHDARLPRTAALSQHTRMRRSRRRAMRRPPDGSRGAPRRPTRARARGSRAGARTR